jgi:phosphoglycerol transferase
MIFQLPLMNFIDGDAIGAMGSYEHVRPYLWTKHLRFSSGSVQGRRREDWQEQIAAMPVAQAAQALERLGFAGLYLNRKAFTDRAEAMLQDLVKLGRGQFVEDNAREQVCVMLKPSPQPALPHSDDAAQIVYRSNWSYGTYTLRERGTRPARWALARTASLYFVNESSQPASFHLTAMVAASSARRVDVEFEDQVIATLQLEPGESQPLDLRLLARPGRNYLYFKNDRSVVPPVGQPLAVRVAHCLIDLQIVKDPPSQP